MGDAIDRESGVMVVRMRGLAGIWLVLAMLLGVPMAAVAQSATPADTTGAASPEATPVAASPTDDQLRKAGVNELGVVPVLMYHTFTSDSANVTEWTRTFDGFRQQLQDLYDLGFTTISMRDLLENTIDVPLGRHPIVLTFDDASASQFLIDEQADGSITPRANSAVGVLESFFADHPDFGHSAFFAVVPNYCFADADIDELNSYDSCQAKLDWLSGHGYEIGNHTLDHEDLSTVDVEEFVHQVGGTAAWIDEHVSGPANLSGVLVLPYGGRPAPGSAVDQVMNGWFRYGGEDYHLDAIVDVAGGPMYSPSSTWFNPGKISRINSDPDSFDYLVKAVSGGEMLLYTSDGNPDTVTIPNPIPDFLANEFDAAAIKADGKTLIRYDAGSDAAASPSGPVASPPAMSPLAVGGTVATIDTGVRLRDKPGTEGTVLVELEIGARLTIVGGPQVIDGKTWWQVETADGTTGWVVGDYLATSSGS
ncbi:MAG: SH3 domain-containing protein [Thermomicrobiales bacterium]